MRLRLAGFNASAAASISLITHRDKPQTIDDLVNHHVGRVLDLFDIDPGLVQRWQGVQQAIADAK